MCDNEKKEIKQKVREEGNDGVFQNEKKGRKEQGERLNDFWGKRNLSGRRSGDGSCLCLNLKKEPDMEKNQQPAINIS